MKISIIASQSEQGRSLANMLITLLPLFFIEKGFSVHIEEPVFNGVQYDMLKATLECDLVIFDASIEWNEKMGFDSNYFVATANPISDDRILVVSRTKLPINYVPMRSNIPILGEEHKEKDEHGVLRSKYHYTNDEIIKWVTKTLDEMILEKRIPKDPSAKITVPPFEQLSTIANQLTFTIEKNSFDSLDYMKAKARGKRGAFVSYRSRYCYEKINGWDVYKLSEYIKEKHKDNNFPVLYYADGDISKEFMTEQRRWEIVSFVDRRLREVKEVWIFNTVDYLDSWWTQGEILALMYIKAASPNELPEKIVLFDPNTGKIEEKGTDFIPYLSDELVLEISRYYANSDAITSGNEGMGNMRMLRNVNGILRRLAYFQMKKIQKKMYSPESELAKVMDSISYESYVESINSHVYDLSFTENRVAACPNCQRKNICIDNFKEESFIRDFIKTNSDDLNEHITINKRGFFDITETMFEDILNKQEWKCPKCNTPFSVQHEPENNQYRWWAIRMGQETGPKGVVIERITVYEINEKKDKNYRI